MVDTRNTKEMVAIEEMDHVISQIREQVSLDAQRIARINHQIRQLFDFLPGEAQLPNMVRIIQDLEQEYVQPGEVTERDIRWMTPLLMVPMTLDQFNQKYLDIS